MKEILFTLPENREQLAEFLHRHPQSVNERWDQVGSPLHVAATRGQLAEVCLLLSYNPDLDIRNVFGQTPEERALAMDHFEIARVIHEFRCRNDRMSQVFAWAAGEELRQAPNFG
ncbi:MAG: ankyrin repeat domain-containing protein [Sulfobacillus sp.]